MDNANKNENLLNLSNVYDEYDEELLKIYIGNNFDQITTKSFNIWACLFNIIYLLYRKMYLFGFICALIFLLVCFINSIVVFLIYIFLVGFFANYVYKIFANKNINKIKLNCKDKTIDDVRKICKRKGGTSLILGFIGFGVQVVLLFVGYLFMSYGDKLAFSKSEFNPFFNPEKEQIELPGMYNVINKGIDIYNIITSESYDGEMEILDDENIANSFKISVPLSYKNNSTYYMYDYEYSKIGYNGKCKLKFYAAEDYLSDKKLVNDMVKFYKNYNSSDIREENINNINWYNFSTEYQNKTYYYITKKDRKVYVLEYNVEQQSPEECANNFKHIIQSITEL